MKLWVRYGKKKPFRPRLRIESTGFAPQGQWTATFYLSELARTGHTFFLQ